MRIELEYQPRTRLHAAIHAGLERHRFGSIVTHRRFGKTVLALCHLVIKCLENARDRPEPRYAFIQPFQQQVKRNAWEYLNYYTQTIPGCKSNVSELKVTLPHGGFVALYGADNPQAFRGGYFDGVVLDEYALMSPILFPQVIRPTLNDFQGFCYFLDTPRGHNDFYKRCQQAQEDPSWFYACHKASETGILAADELLAARKDMTEDEYLQEYECSFEAAVRGAIYRKELDQARQQGRISRVPYDPLLPVDTDWDLGIGDAMVIWFSQSLKSGEVRVIDFYEASGEGFGHFAGVLKAKGYSYGTHWAPHDIQVRELGSGKSRLEAAAAFGLKFEVTPRINSLVGQEVEEGIHAVRMLLPRCWFDAEKCKPGLEALQHYRRDYNQRLNEFKATPIHDWSSHAADAFRGLAVRHQTPKDRSSVHVPLPTMPRSGSGWAAW